MVKSFRETASLFSTEVILVIDDDDETLGGYLALPKQFDQISSGPLWPPNPVQIMVIPAAEGGSLTAATNTAAARIWHEDCIIGHVGDDHRFKTVGWDKAIIEAIGNKPGVAYGDDGYWGERLPTAAFLHSSIPRALGWYANPITKHYGIDDTWGDLGRGIGALHYLPDVKIIQPGPEETYRNGDAVFFRAQEHRNSDADAYFRWRDGQGRVETIERLRAAL